MNQSIDKTRKTTLPSRKKSAEELLVSLGRALAECDAAIKRRDALVCERPAESLDSSIPHFPCCHWTVDVTIHDDGTREEYFAFTGGGTMLKKPFRSLAEVPALKPDNPADFARWCPSCQKRPEIALEIRALKRKVGAARSVLTKRARKEDRIRDSLPPPVKWPECSRDERPSNGECGERNGGLLD